jgi:hypothetical protein
MNSRYFARALTRALWVGGIAAVALGASKGAARGESIPAPGSTGDSLNTVASADATGGSADASSARTLIAGIPRDTVYGRSGKLRVRFVSARRGTFAIPILTRLFGDSAVRNPGVYALPDSAADQPISFITLLPFDTKVKGTVGSYRIGYWPEERGRLRNEAYENPDGFVVVTPENQDLQVSEHFRLRDFLTHDQQNVWPKYLVLSPRLVDKLELVMSDLEQHGISTKGVHVMSGFRTPNYNANGGETAGRADLSRHMFGDASDIYIDNDGNGVMDDLNHDGKIDINDSRVILEAEERVEKAYPELIGGGGLYRAAPGHGPFIHIDTRGYRARW